MPYQPYYQYYSVPMVRFRIFRELIDIDIKFVLPLQNVPTIWPQNYQGEFSFDVLRSDFFQNKAHHTKIFFEWEFLPLKFNFDQLIQDPLDCSFFPSFSISIDFIFEPAKF